MGPLPSLLGWGPGPPMSIPAGGNALIAPLSKLDLPTSSLIGSPPSFLGWDLNPPMDLPAGGDAFIAPMSKWDLDTVQADTALNGAPWFNLSEYMLGKVVVNVVLLESDGSYDSSTENWTSAQVYKVQSEVTEALQWWTDTLGTQYPGNTQPLQFSVVYSIAGTRYEPINRPHTDQGLWIGDYLSDIGLSTYNASYGYMTTLRLYDNALRDAYGTDWATTVFVVNSNNDSNGNFADGNFAYSYLGGPFLAMTYTNDGWGPDRMAMVLAHELGHTFYALDEYPNSVSCTNYSGYYNTQNLNAYDGNPDPGARVASIMAEANLQEIAYANHTSSPTSLRTIGWQDSDQDGILDVLDQRLCLTGTGGTY